MNLREPSRGDAGLLDMHQPRWATSTARDLGCEESDRLQTNGEQAQDHRKVLANPGTETKGFCITQGRTERLASF